MQTLIVFACRRRPLKNRYALAVLALMLVGACDIDNSVERRSTTEVFLQEPNSLVDILWIIDSSPSMADEQQLIAEGFDSFIGTLEESNADFHLGVLNMDMDLDYANRAMLIGTPAFLTLDDDYAEAFKARVKVGVGGSDKEKGISAGLTAVTEPLVSGHNAGFIRESANLVIVFVSDEDDCSDGDALNSEVGAACYEQRGKLLTVKHLIQAYQSLKTGDARVMASAIIGPAVSQQQDCVQDVWPGHRYEGMVQALGGVIGNICERDYSGLMEDLGLAVAGELTVFNLKYAAVPATIEVVVDDEVILEDPVDGWTYEPEYKQIRFDGSYLPPRGSSISIKYEIAGPA
jgi:hypothetical protein